MIKAVSKIRQNNNKSQTHFIPEAPTSEVLNSLARRFIPRSDAGSFSVGGCLLTSNS